MTACGKSSRHNSSDTPWRDPLGSASRDPQPDAAGHSLYFLKLCKVVVLSGPCFTMIRRFIMFDISLWLFLVLKLYFLLHIYLYIYIYTIDALNQVGSNMMTLSYTISTDSTLHDTRLKCASSILMITNELCSNMLNKNLNKTSTYTTFRTRDKGNQADSQEYQWTFMHVGAGSESLKHIVLRFKIQNKLLFYYTVSHTR